MAMEQRLKGGFTTLAAFGVAAIGCSGTTETPYITRRPEQLDGVAESCKVAGGRWEDYECRCGPGEGPDGGAVPRVFTTESGGSCAPIELSTAPCMARGFRTMLAEQGVNAVRSCLRGNLLRVKRSTLSVSSSFPEAVAPDLASWLDDTVRSGSFWPNLPSEAGWQQQVIVTFELPTPQYTPILLDRAPIYPIPGSPPGAGAVVIRTLYATTVVDLGSTTGAERQPRTLDRSRTPPPLQMLLDAVDRASPFSRATDYSTTPILRGCLGACEVTGHFRFESDGATYSIKRARRYHGGTILDERLELASADHRQLLGWVNFDLAKNPNYFATFEYSESAFSPTVKTYDGALTPLGEVKLNALDVAKFDAASTTLGSARALSGGEVGVVVCEGDYGRALDAGLAKALVLGPHQGLPGQEGTSAFGWRTAPTADVESYLDGVITTRFALPVDDQSYVDHAREVSHLVLGAGPTAEPWPGLRIVPLSAMTCILRPEVLEEISSRSDASQIRIVSLSAAYPVDQSACAASMPMGANPHYLWVLASGNWGRAFADLESAQNCPQVLRQRSNLLVVDGVTETEYWDFSDHGPAFSDIAAECQANGTSLAAPRVAHAAARIAQAQGDRISVQMIRAAILLSATLAPLGPEAPGTGVLPNRSGGILQLDDALRMAQAIVDHGWGIASALGSDQVRVLLASLYGDATYGDTTIVEFKLRRLSNNGFFE